jgi:hypothetical protein
MHPPPKHVKLHLGGTQTLMVNNAQVASHQFIFKTRSVGNHNPVTLICDNDTRSRKTNTLAKPDVTSDRKMVELGDVGDRFEAFLKVLKISIDCILECRSITHGNLFELVTQLDNRSSAKLSRLVHCEDTVLESVKLGLDQEQITETSRYQPT